LGRLDEGSEHIVFLDPANALVIKCTRPGIFGDAYYLADGRVNQRNCSPREYLARLKLWDQVFGRAPVAMGFTPKGQIVSSQEYMVGVKPSQKAVDEFLERIGYEAVRRQCWLWRRSFPNYEVWAGDTRDENFVQTTAGIVPIDVRLWCVNTAADRGDD
jgi:hypothetical protein